MHNLEVQPNPSKTKEAILYLDNTKENNLIQLIIKAQEQGFNCLDLSTRNINEFPSQLLEFTSLQVHFNKRKTSHSFFLSFSIYI